ncbi:hypothetical protein [Maritimibacter sp. DP1N21-5]|uniref:hypothetical protein n=1 Tax=Maritimibacter sp. DP1N21-5 TaxID=2836867 RepID=UPI001C47FA74|nr:hypothetical protein [Maritimibacter sp. DP1N21-5]MBV7410263.1 hypothetical protein [Maritimibacter sp. DP1N21-5]
MAGTATSRATWRVIAWAAAMAWATVILLACMRYLGGLAIPVLWILAPLWLPTVIGLFVAAVLAVWPVRDRVARD